MGSPSLILLRSLFWAIGILTAALSLVSIFDHLIGFQSSDRAMCIADCTSDKVTLVEVWVGFVEPVANFIPRSLNLIIETNSLAVSFLSFIFSVFAVRLLTSQILIAWHVSEDPTAIQRAWRWIIGGDLRSKKERRIENLKSVALYDGPVFLAILIAYFGVILKHNIPFGRLIHWDYIFAGVGATAAGVAFKKLIEEPAWRRLIIYILVCAGVVILFRLVPNFSTPKF